MSRRLDALRAAADAGECEFILLTALQPASVPATAWTAALAERFDDRWRSSESCGYLNDGSLGILLVQPLATRNEDIDSRRDWFLDALADSGCANVTEYSYPLVPLATVATDETFHGLPLYPEGGIEQFFIKPTPLWKRTLDIAVAATLLITLLPLLLLVALLVKLTSRGPIFFCQPRTGCGGRAFSMLKFRSMVVEAESLQKSLRNLNEQDGPAFKISLDPRITWLGRWLRRSCLDELPQLWNILRGEMSLVGPRPLPLCESAACAGWQRRRLEITPGITGLWQVRGRHKSSFDEWMHYDLEYLEQRSLALDLRIIFSTVPSLIPWRPRSAPINVGPAPELDTAADGAGN